MSFSCFRGNSFFSADRRRLEFQSGDRAIKNIMRTLIIFTARIVTTCAPVFPQCLLSGDRDRQNSYMLICCDRCASSEASRELRRNFRDAFSDTSFITQPHAVFASLNDCHRNLFKMAPLNRFIPHRHIVAPRCYRPSDRNPS